MSSLKDIMDVDVEPLQSQAYRRSKEAAQQQASFQPSVTTSTETNRSPPTDDEEEPYITNTGKHPLKRRRSPRASTGTKEASQPDYQGRRNSATGQPEMEYQLQYPSMGPGAASTSGSPQQMSRQSEGGSDIPVKYTPVTGRISKAKKGVPVHTCDICRPAKTFTRAEHLRRHQLSHQKPAYPCTFENCERAFHRPDLLARHMHRHDIGEKAHVAGDRSREPSSASESQPLTLNTESRFGSAPDSGADTSTPRTTMTMSSASTITITQPAFPNVNYSPGSTSSHKRSAAEAQLDPYPVTSPVASIQNSFDQLLSHTGGSTAEELPLGGGYISRTNSGFDELYNTGGEQFPANYTTAGSPLNNSRLPLLRIPDEPYPTHIAYTQDNSPWCSSSASDSTFSNQSDASRTGRWAPRGRSGSLADWPASATSQWSPQMGTPQDINTPPLADFMDQYSEGRMGALAAPLQHLDVPSSYGRYLMESVGTPTLSTNSKPISQVFPASSSRISAPGLADVNVPREEEQLATFSCPPMTSKHQAQSLDLYINSYWHEFHPLFPFIHHPTFDTEEGSLLPSALAAIGTQYHHTPEARRRGSELNELCRKALDQCPNWSLETMQAILLTEIFSRFRGRRTTTKLSRRFEELCHRLLHPNDPTYRAPNSTSPVDATLISDLRDRFSLLDESHPLQHPDPSNAWVQWVDMESRQRLLSACFMFDVHQSLYHQLPRSRNLKDESQPFLSLPCLDSLWNASNASEWLNYQTNLANGHSLQVPSSQHLPIASSSFSQSLLIYSLATQLPLDIQTTYSNLFRTPPLDFEITDLMNSFTSVPLAQTYLALHYTHLHDLLAVAADTWVFSKKVTPPQAFHDAQRRLQSWCRSEAAAQAVHHACRVLSLSLSQSYNHEGSCHTNALVCVTEYWSLYVAALICWAFGHRSQIMSKPSTLLRHDSNATVGKDNANNSAQVQANTYLDAMLELGVGELSKSPIKGQTSGVIDAVRQRIMKEGVNVGGRCSMLIDCIAVLGKISKSGTSKWF